MKHNLMTLFAGILMVTASQEAEARVRIIHTINPLNNFIGVAAGMGFFGTSIYSLYNSIAATYYSTFRNDPIINEGIPNVEGEGEYYNDKKCREHHRAAFVSWLATIGLSGLATVAFLPGTSYAGVID